MHFLSLVPLLLLLVSSPISVLSAPVPNTAEALAETEMGPLVRYDAPEKATASIILLHGLGNTDETFHALEQRFHAQDRFKHINFIFPNAPLRNSPYWHNWTGGQPFIQAWFNMSASTLGMYDWFDQDQYWGDVDYINDLVINETARGIPADRIIAGGFSQGGMVALGGLAGIHTKIGGWLYFSSELPNLTSFFEHLDFANQRTPVFHGHGMNDTVIVPSHAIATANHFQNLGYDYHLHFYPGMGHQVTWDPNLDDVEGVGFADSSKEVEEVGLGMVLI